VFQDGATGSIFNELILEYFRFMKKTEFEKINLVLCVPFRVCVLNCIKLLSIKSVAFMMCEGEGAILRDIIFSEILFFIISH